LAQELLPRYQNIFHTYDSSLWTTRLPSGLDPRRIKEQPKAAIQFIQDLTIQRVVYPPGIVWIPFHVDQACLAQDAQVVRDEIGRHVQRVTQHTIALDALHEHVQDAQAFGLCQHFELVGESQQVCGWSVNASDCQGYLL
jgi:hypothetical protein